MSDGKSPPGKDEPMTRPASAEDTDPESVPAGEDPTKADCYSAGDRIMMVWWQALRARTLNPLLAGLDRIGITADGITLWSFVLGVAFCPMWFVHPGGALICLALHVLVDGLDGPLARYRGTASAKGSLSDTTCDQTIVAASTAVLICAEFLSALGGMRMSTSLAVPKSWACALGKSPSLREALMSAISTGAG